ncbi:MAG: hypothetical protein II776_03700, partial [Clostridia bacterium]|nr:hypothetical protein [Clostridia bacterium]
MDHYPEIVWEQKKGVSPLRWAYHDYLAERFARAYCGTLGDWCEKNGLALAGHLRLEQSLYSQTRCMGEAMRCYARFKKMPGIDMLRDDREFTTALQCRSVARQQGSEAVLSELYGVTGWDADFRLYKLQGDWQAALGVTCRVPHLFWMTMKGEAKRDYPASIGPQSPWWREYGAVEDHFARLNTALTRGERQGNVAVIHPIESYWLLWGPAMQTAAARDAMDRRFSELTRALLCAMVDFDFISEALLPDFCPAGGAPLRVGRAAYDTVIVPGCSTLRTTTLERLEAFRAAGGRLIFLGEAPVMENGRESDRGRALYDRSERVPYDPDAAAELLAADAFAEVRLLSSTAERSFVRNDGSRSRDFLHQLRKDGDGYWFFLCHAFRPDCPDVDAAPFLSVTLRGSFRAEEYDTLTGEIRPFPVSRKGGRTSFQRRFYMHDSLLLRLTPAADGTEDAPAPAKTAPSSIRKLAPEVPVTLDEPNACLLDRAAWALDDGPWQEPEEILRIDAACRKAAGLPLRKKAVAQPYCIRPVPPTHRVRLRFSIPSEIDLEGIRLALEDAGDCNVVWNGEAVAGRPDGWYVDRCYGTLPLPPLKRGENLLEVTVPLGERTNLEWLYLLGDFGVRAAGCGSVITPPVRRLAFGDVTHQGLPFYTGNIVYRPDLPADGRDLSLAVARYRGACVAVRLDGKDAGRIIYAPYRLDLGRPAPGKHTLELTLFGTRQNGFAQLHHTPGVRFYQDP